MVFPITYMLILKWEKNRNTRWKILDAQERSISSLSILLTWPKYGPTSCFYLFFFIYNPCYLEISYPMEISVKWKYDTCSLRFGNLQITSVCCKIALQVARKTASRDIALTRSLGSIYVHLYNNYYRNSINYTTLMNQLLMLLATVLSNRRRCSSVSFNT